MLQNEDIVDIEKSDEVCSPDMNGFSGLFLPSSIFSIKNWRSSKIINGALSGFWYWLNTNS